jgi:Pentapeptide repeats (8 copies)
MDPTVAAAAIGVTGTVVVGVTGYWASVKNTSKTTELTRTAVELTRRTVELTEQGQVTERYTKAIDQLGAIEIDVRVGGIYALERIARDSARDQPTVMEVLAAFVRDHSGEQWPPPTVHEAGANPPGRLTRPDVQAALTVMGRRTIRDDSQQINLAAAILISANLRGANLVAADLSGADLREADLSGADLSHASLSSADLNEADLSEAILNEADLSGTDLSEADFTSARLIGAQLGGAHLDGAKLGFAHLQGARLRRADLSNADLREADLSGADFGGADLSDAVWPLETEVPQGWQGKAGSARADPRGLLLPLETEVPQGWQGKARSVRLERSGTNPGSAPMDPAPSV